jgi:hypothetical protein
MEEEPPASVAHFTARRLLPSDQAVSLLSSHPAARPGVWLEVFRRNGANSKAGGVERSSATRIDRFKTQDSPGVLPANLTPHSFFHCDSVDEMARLGDALKRVVGGEHHAVLAEGIDEAAAAADAISSLRSTSNSD